MFIFFLRYSTAKVCAHTFVVISYYKECSVLFCSSTECSVDCKNISKYFNCIKYCYSKF